jgi:hypothetical protein
MQEKRVSMRHYLPYVLLIWLTACGYKPSVHAIKTIFPGTVYVEVKVDRAEPENAPFVKDEMNRLVYTRLKGKVVSEEEADSKIEVSYGGSSFYPLAYEDGYVTRYRANVRVRFKVVSEDGNFTKKISSRVESDIQASSLTSSTLRTEAIKRGLEKAMDEFMAYLSVRVITKENKKNKKKKLKSMSLKDNNDSNTL